jgi:hypothetical protein
VERALLRTLGARSSRSSISSQLASREGISWEHSVEELEFVLLSVSATWQATGSAGLASWANGLLGRRTVTVDPLPGSVLISMLPSCASTYFLHRNRPRPVPPLFVVKKGPKILSWTPFSIPQPLSMREIETFCRLLIILAEISTV